MKEELLYKIKEALCVTLAVVVLGLVICMLVGLKS
jgi:hypothetical protein